eukprot:gene9514-6681_t
MSRLVQQMNNVQSCCMKAGIAHQFNFPRISSVLEAIVGRAFLPRGTGIVTRCPLCLTLHPCPVDEAEYGVFEHKGDQRWLDFDAILDEIAARTKVLAPKDGEVVHNAIVLELYMHGAVELSLVDLPGRVRVATDDQRKDLPQHIDELVRDFIKQSNTIILAALEIANEEDKDKLRTVGVITKVDKVEKPETIVSILKMDKNWLKLGYFALKCRGVDASVTVAQSREEEVEFFTKTRAFAPVMSKCGVANLSKFLSGILQKHFEKELPQLLITVENSLASIRQDLRSLGMTQSMFKGRLTKEKAGQLFENVVIDLCSRLKQSIAGGLSQQSSHHAGLVSTGKQLSSGAKVRLLNHVQFPDTLKKVRVRQPAEVELSQAAGSYPPDKAILPFIRENIKQLRDPVVDLAASTAKILKESFLQEIERWNYLDRFVLHVNDRFTRFLGKLTQNAEAQLEQMIRWEEQLVDLSSPDMKLVSSMMRVHRDRKLNTDGKAQLTNELKRKQSIIKGAQNWETVLRESLMDLVENFPELLPVIGGLQKFLAGVYEDGHVDQDLVDLAIHIPYVLDTTLRKNEGIRTTTETESGEEEEEVDPEAEDIKNMLDHNDRDYLRLVIDAYVEAVRDRLVTIAPKLITLYLTGPLLQDSDGLREVLREMLTDGCDGVAVEDVMGVNAQSRQRWEDLTAMEKTLSEVTRSRFSAPYTYEHISMSTTYIPYIAYLMFYPMLSCINDEGYPSFVVTTVSLFRSPLGAEQEECGIHIYVRLCGACMEWNGMECDCYVLNIYAILVLSFPKIQYILTKLFIYLLHICILYMYMHINIQECCSGMVAIVVCLVKHNARDPIFRCFFLLLLLLFVCLISYGKYKTMLAPKFRFHFYHSWFVLFVVGLLGNYNYIPYIFNWDFADSSRSSIYKRDNRRRFVLLVELEMYARLVVVRPYAATRTTYLSLVSRSSSTSSLHSAPYRVPLRPYSGSGTIISAVTGHTPPARPGPVSTPGATFGGVDYSDRRREEAEKALERQRTVQRATDAQRSGVEPLPDGCGETPVSEGERWWPKEHGGRTNWSGSMSHSMLDADRKRLDGMWVPEVTAPPRPEAPEAISYATDQFFNLPDLHMVDETLDTTRRFVPPPSFDPALDDVDDDGNFTDGQVMLDIQKALEEDKRRLEAFGNPLTAEDQVDHLLAPQREGDENVQQRSEFNGFAHWGLLHGAHMVVEENQEFKRAHEFVNRYLRDIDLFCKWLEHPKVRQHIEKKFGIDMHAKYDKLMAITMAMYTRSKIQVYEDDPAGALKSLTACVNLISEGADMKNPRHRKALGAVLVARGMVYCKLKSFERSEDDLTRALAFVKAERSATLFQLRAEAREALGRVAEARDDEMRAAEIWEQAEVIHPGLDGAPRKFVL